MSENKIKQPGIPFHIHIAPHSITTSTAYNTYVFMVIHTLARCMNYNFKKREKLAARLYYELTLEGFKRKGHYETILPHLVRVVNTEDKCEHGDMSFGCNRRDPVTNEYIQCAIILMQRTGVIPGLYECSIELDLSNPWWRLECSDFDHDTHTWNMAEISQGVPPGQSNACDVNITINILRYTAPLPPDDFNESSSWATLKSWIPSQFERARTEFNKVFNER
jgi:hypothetical protein